MTVGCSWPEGSPMCLSAAARGTLARARPHKTQRNTRTNTRTTPHAYTHTRACTRARAQTHAHTHAHTRAHRYASAPRRRRVGVGLVRQSKARQRSLCTRRACALRRLIRSLGPPRSNNAVRPAAGEWVGGIIMSVYKLMNAHYGGQLCFAQFSGMVFTPLASSIARPFMPGFHDMLVRAAAQPPHPRPSC